PLVERRLGRNRAPRYRMTKPENNTGAPIKNGRLLNFYGYAIAPEIPAIKSCAEELIRTYQGYVPGSQAASSYLLEMADECRQLIKQLLLPPTQWEKYTIEFFAGTGRAMEVALARAGKSERIILSPFEHPSVVDVAKWYASVSGVEVHQLHF